MPLHPTNTLDGSYLWVTDPHFDCTDPEKFLEPYTNVGLRGAFFTGDLANSRVLYPVLREMRAMKCPVYFVLGNHDYYGTSWETLRTKLRPDVPRISPDLHWMTFADPVELQPGVMLTGHDGWYDATLGSEYSSVLLADFRHVHEIARVVTVTRQGVLGGRDLKALLRETADCWAQEAAANLDKALTHPETREVVFLTHIPPFRGACWHDGKISEDDWLPYFTNKALGDVLTRYATAHPAIHFTVLCGHTHSAGTYQPLPNLLVLTGRAIYGDPQVSGLFCIEASEGSTK